MDFPTIVYRVPGPHYGADGRGFAYLGVADAAEYEAALADGWFATFEEAAGIEAVAPEDTGRDALEAEAKALGVSFNWKTSDEVLAERIAAAK